MALVRLFAELPVVFDSGDILERASLLATSTSLMESEARLHTRYRFSRPLGRADIDAPANRRTRVVGGLWGVFHGRQYTPFTLSR